MATALKQMPIYAYLLKLFHGVDSHIKVTIREGGTDCARSLERRTFERRTFNGALLFTFINSIHSSSQFL
jgi:hypothetical protein